MIEVPSKRSKGKLILSLFATIGKFPSFNVLQFYILMYSKDKKILWLYRSTFTDIGLYSPSSTMSTTIIIPLLEWNKIWQ